MRLKSLLFIALIGVASHRAPASTELEEVHRLLSTNFPSLGPDDLSAPTADALVTQLSPRVRWVEGGTNSPVDHRSIAATRRFPGELGYIRMGSVSGDVASELQSAVDELQRQGPILGLVIDLRFASGRDFPASARASALFFPSGHAVLDWGDGGFTAPGNSNRFAGPVALLVNTETRGSAETLAAALRDAGLALVIGGRTAGEAVQWRDFTLSTGRTLRLAVAPVKTGDGREIAADGLVPDIGIKTTLDADRRFLSDPYASAASSTNSSPDAAAAPQVRRRLTEAELIRTKRESLGQSDPSPSQTNSAPSAAAAKPSLQDPVLARGLDLLTGLNAVRQ